MRITGLRAIILLRKLEATVAGDKPSSQSRKGGKRLHQPSQALTVPKSTPGQKCGGCEGVGRTDNSREGSSIFVDTRAPAACPP